jgi:hypothetical protein
MVLAESVVTTRRWRQECVIAGAPSGWMQITSTSGAQVHPLGLWCIIMHADRIVHGLKWDCRTNGTAETQTSGGSRLVTVKSGGR